jgi:TnpA family transposase
LESKLSESELEFLQSPQYQLKSDELQLIMSEQGERNQLLFAVMLQYYKIRLSFPTQHDEVVKHLVALKMGIVEADVFVKRFSRDNYKHPVYKALCEIGKFAKTIFLCNYLENENLRIEINASLNVVERLNSVWIWKSVL